MDQHTHSKDDSCCEASSVKDQIKAKWNKLSDSDVEVWEKDMDALSGRIQKAYGRTKEVADREVSEFRKTLAAKQAEAKLIL